MTGPPSAVYGYALAGALTGLIGALGLLPAVLPAQVGQLPAAAHLWISLVPIHAAGTLGAGLVLAANRSALRWKNLFAAGASLRAWAGAVRRAAGTVAWVLPAGFALTALTILALRAFGHTPRPAPILRILQSGEGPGFWISVVATTVVVAPLTEEFLFRLVLFEALRKHLPGPGVVASGVFAVAHQTPEQVPALFLLGLVLQRARATDGGHLRTPVLIHAVFNATSVLIYVGFRACGISPAAAGTMLG